MEKTISTPENDGENLCENECKHIARCCFCNKKICKKCEITGKCGSPGFSKFVGSVQLKECVTCHENKVEEILNN